MQVDLGELHAEVYTENRDKKILYIKIYIPSLLMHINSCTVRPSPQYGGLWFQMPAFLMGTKWVKPIEFSGASQFLDLLKDEALRAADRHIQENRLENIYPGSKPDDRLDLSSIPF